MSKPLVSIFLSYYNDEVFLKRAIDAILSQDFRDFELILLNHASTDGSREIAHSYDDARIIHIDKPYNYGAGGGLLLRDMLAVSHGDYIKFCCADDILHSDCLSVLVNFLESNSDYDCVCARMEYVDIAGNKISHKSFRMPSEFTNQNVLQYLFSGENIICFPTVMMRRHVFEKLTIDDTFIMMLDTSLWADLLVKNYSIGCVHDKLISYRIHDGQVSHLFRGVLDTRLFMEHVAYPDVFDGISNPEYIRRFCTNVSFASDVTDKDIEFFPFIIALHNLRGRNLSFAIAGYLRIHNMMNDSCFRDKIERRFGFTVTEFRNAYTKLPAMEEFLSVRAKQIPLGRLLGLACRRIFRAFTPKNLTRGLRHWCRKHTVRRTITKEV